MTHPSDPPRYEPYAGPQAAAGAMLCPKCGGPMRTYERNGIHLEQCSGCRGVFLDFGELEHLTQLESRFAQQPPPQPNYGPAWGSYGNQKYRRGGLSGLFFSS
ncbi:MAG TPA: zf-TFIIB domain-containing protein [Propionicimonas sp.]|nr:zf-TFIIB domain-containing protein [Propionicimonas sp.]HQA78248.1 zf-TFIIB domain-containing protein [Propionicimonas sp.]HQD97210.1 zf-TFIIB domain-containing protein [Propionicimonas sp.]